MSQTSDIFSRETFAGFDRDRLECGAVTLVGCGAAGNNIAQNLALSGVGELRFVDPDDIEPSNLTRSPLFDPARLQSERRRLKANECARSVLGLSYASTPVVRSAVARVEDLGLGAFADCGVVIAAVDSLPVRAWLADATRLLGIPLVEVGFSAPRGQISVFPNVAADDPCWRCLHPHVLHGSASCEIYARRVIATGRVPATQPLAAFFGALAAEAAILALQGEFPLANHLVTFDIRNGTTRRLELTRDPSCPGQHCRWDAITQVAARANEPVAVLLDAVRSELAEPVLHLPETFLRAAPCHACGRMVPIGRPVRAVTEPPACDDCGADEREPSLASAGESAPVLDRVPVFVNTIARGDELARWKAQRFGLRPGSVVELRDRASDAALVVALAGGPDDLYVTRRRGTAAPLIAPDEGFTVIG